MKAVLCTTYKLNDSGAQWNENVENIKGADEEVQCSPHNSNPLNKNFRLLRRNPGSHRRNNTNNSNGKIRLNRRSKIQFTS